MLKQSGELQTTTKVMKFVTSWPQKQNRRKKWQNLPVPSVVYSIQHVFEQCPNLVPILLPLAYSAWVKSLRDSYSWYMYIKEKFGLEREPKKNCCTVALWELSVYLAKKVLCRCRVVWFIIYTWFTIKYSVGSVVDTVQPWFIHVLFCQITWYSTEINPILPLFCQQNTV